MATPHALWLYTVQFVFLATGVFSTCAAQYIFYQGAGDQRAMLLPLCNFLGITLVGLIPVSAVSDAKPPPPSTTNHHREEMIDRERDEPERTVPSRLLAEDQTWERRHQLAPLLSEEMELTRRLGADSSTVEDTDTDTDLSSPSSFTTASPVSEPAALDRKLSRSTLYCSASTLQLCIGLAVVLDFGGCIFSNMGLAMAGSGLYQVVYSSVICWSALLSRFVLKKSVSKEEWFGIALVTFGLAFSALGDSSSGRNSYVVLMGCLNTLLGAAFYGGNYVTGEYMLKLPERPHPKELCLKIGAACVGIIAVYQIFFVLPAWHDLVTKPIVEHQGNTTGILLALFTYTLSQLAHGLTYFQLLGSSGAVTTGIMQSLRAVCVFIISSLLYCSHQESQCFNTKRGVATLIVVCGVMFYSWAKGQAKAAPAATRKKAKLLAGKNFVV